MYVHYMKAAKRRSTGSLVKGDGRNNSLFFFFNSVPMPWQPGKSSRHNVAAASQYILKQKS